MDYVGEGQVLSYSIHLYSFSIEFLDSMTYAEPIQFIQYQTHPLEILGNLNITV
jgi:hypothetical protein